MTSIYDAPQLSADFGTGSKFSGLSSDFKSTDSSNSFINAFNSLIYSIDSNFEHKIFRQRFSDIFYGISDFLQKFRTTKNDLLAVYFILNFSCSIFRVLGQKFLQMIIAEMTSVIAQMDRM